VKTPVQFLSSDCFFENLALKKRMKNQLTNNYKMPTLKVGSIRAPESKDWCQASPRVKPTSGERQQTKATGTQGTINRVCERSVPIARI